MYTSFELGCCEQDTKIVNKNAKNILKVIFYKMQQLERFHKMAAYVQGFVQVGNSTPRLPEPPAECRIKKLIIYSFADRLRSARTADDSSTNADVYSVCPTCTKPIVVSTPFFILNKLMQSI
jgi:hypothetical protein